MYLYITWICIFSARGFVIKASKANEAPLTLAERMRVFGTTSTLSLPDLEYASVQQLNTSYLKPLRKRPANTLLYTITLDNETFILTLKPNRHLIEPGCLVRDFSNSSRTPTIYPCTTVGFDCYYTGSTNVHNESWVALNVCGGLRGLIKLGNTSLFVLPWMRNYSSHPNFIPEMNNSLVYRYQSEKQVCGSNGVPGDRFHVVAPQVPGRKKRQAQSTTKYIETSLTIDPSMVRFHGEDLHDYVNVMANIAYKLFRDKSIASDIHLVISDIFILPEDASLNISSSAKDYLNSFCRYKEEHDRIASVVRNRPNGYDVNVLITRIDIEFENDFDTTGLSNVGSACIPSSKCAIVEDNGPSMAQTLVHEIGHLLGLTHDGSSPSNQCKLRIMAPIGQVGEEAFTWSQCSANELRNSINEGKLDCMDNVPEHLNTAISKDQAMPLPGMIYDANEQCSFVLNRTEAELCTTHNDPCREINCAYGYDLCSEKAGDSLAVSQSLFDGTDCNNTRSWCMKGKCVPMTSKANTARIHGGWSEWNGFSKCSKTCGAGVKIRKRWCKNPKPQYGGRPCTGRNIKAEICNVNNCQSTNNIYLEEIDYANNTCKAHAYVYRPDFENKTVFGDKGCEFTCQKPGAELFRSIAHQEYYPCHTLDIDVPFSRCIEHKCRKFGCDGIMDSGVKNDVCGQCGGNGTSCRKVTDTYTSKVRYIVKKHQMVVTIPKTSTGITLVQNHSSLFFELNINNKRTILSDPGITTKTLFEEEDDLRVLYDVNPETVRINGPLKRSIVVLTIIKPSASFGYDDIFSVTYSYHVPVTGLSYTRFNWAVKDLGCSVSCGGGINVKRIECWNMVGPVDDFYCDIDKKPSEQPHSCNMHPCPAVWQYSEWGPCSVSCGPGFKSRSSTCMQFQNRTNKVVDGSLCGIYNAPVNMSCNNGMCPGVWKIVSKSQCSKTCGRGYDTRAYRCYENATSSLPIEDNYCRIREKPQDRGECNDGVCYNSSSCVDTARYPCGIYGQDICYGEFSGWAEDNCKRSCGICGCVDRPRPGIDCNLIDRKYCTDPNYVGFMRNHCAKYCCLCDSAP